MRNTFIKKVNEYAKKDSNIIMLAGDLGFNVLNGFYDELPNQFVNAGVAEQNMTSMAAGMALEGKKVYTYSIANFPTLRCIEQIRNDILYHNCNVKIVSVGAGLGYGSLGMSHHGTEDLGMMRCLPNIVIFSPSDAFEAERIGELAYQYEYPAYIRLGKADQIIHNEKKNFNIGDSINVIKGDKVAIFTTGPIAGESYKAAKKLNDLKISTALYTFPTIKPIDTETIKACANKFDLIVTVEENNIIGGLGSAVAEVLVEEKHNAIVKKMGLNDTYVSEVGNPEYLRKLYNIDSESIIDTIINIIKGDKR